MGIRLGAAKVSPIKIAKASSIISQFGCRSLSGVTVKRSYTYPELTVRSKCENLLVLDLSHSFLGLKSSASSKLSTIDCMRARHKAESVFPEDIHPKITATALKKRHAKLVQNRQRNRKAGYRAKFPMHGRCCVSSKHVIAKDAKIYWLLATLGHG